MRKRIGLIAKGKFEYVKPTITFSENPIHLEVLEDMDYSGSFTMNGTHHDRVRGIIYSTNDRMECLTPQFEGEETKIRYRFHSRGLTSGEVYEGDFVIVCNGCAYNLPFRATVTRRYPESTLGEIKSLYDFSCLAKENWEEAYQLFYHKSFPNLIKPKEIKEAMIYRGIVAAKPSNQNMEEFLIGIRKKSRITFAVEKNKLFFQDLLEDVKETLTVTKDGWGFFSIHVRVDAEFLQPDKTAIGPGDFLGSRCELPFMILVDKLHSGNNYGRIILENVYQTLVVEVTVKNIFDWKPTANRKQIQECQVGILELYQAYRLKRIVTGVWANETIDILNHLHALDPEEPMYVLMKAQAFIINRQRQEAEWILDEFRKNWTQKRSPVWGYYLYLLTLMEREPAYVDKMTREIEIIQRENPDSVLLFWVLSFLEEQYYNNSAQKLSAIERWVLNGCSSPYLYLEAYYLLCQEPFLLNKLGIFEIRILRWAIKNKALNKDLAEQIFSIVELSKNFSKIYYQLLCAAYEVLPTPEHIGMICSYLIKGQQYSTKYHSWFEKGIELELRITSLYEAYLLSMDEHEISNVPKIIQMYFQYESRLPYKKMAVLYNNIIASRRESPEIYQKYRKTMGEFAMEQVEKERMDDNLAVLYTEMLDLGLVNQDIAHSLAHILFTHKLFIFDERMVRVWIYQRQMKEPQIVPIVDRVAYFQLFSKEYVILFEDAKGHRFAGSVSYQVQNLMNPDPYLEKCMELAPEEIPYIVSHFDTKLSYLNFSKEDEKFFARIIYSQSLSNTYKAEMIPEILHYYHIHQSDRVVQEYMKETDASILSGEARRFFAEMLVENRMYDEVWELIHEYGIDLIRPASKLTLALHIMEQSGQEEDEYLVRLAYGAFSEGKYNDTLLDYLCRYYSGPTEAMFAVWKAAEGFHVNMADIEERILSQMLFAGQMLEGIEPLFAHFHKNSGAKLLLLAYITTRADAYFVQDKPTEELVFDLIRRYYLSHKELNDPCKLALLKKIASKGSSGGVDYQIADELLSEFTSRNMIFSFYKKMNASLIQKYHLYDKVILEYRTSPQKHVVIHYSRDEDGAEFIAEDMVDVYNGIFVKQFVMFFGEMIQYYISEEQGSQVEVTQSNRLVNHDVYNQKDESRYSLINQMLMSNTLMEEESLNRYMQRYEELDEMTRQMFRIL